MALHDGGDFWGHVSTGREGAVSNCSWDSQTSGTGGGWESRSNSLLSFTREDPFDKKASKEVHRLFQDIDLVLFGEKTPNKQLPPPLIAECLEWSSRFLHIRAVGEQLLRTPSNQSDAAEAESDGHNFVDGTFFHGAPSPSQHAHGISREHTPVRGDGPSMCVIGHNVSPGDRPHGPCDMSSAQDHTGDPFWVTYEEVFARDGTVEECFAYHTDDNDAVAPGPTAQVPGSTAWESCDAVDVVAMQLFEHLWDAVAPSLLPLAEFVARDPPNHQPHGDPFRRSSSTESMSDVGVGPLNQMLLDTLTRAYANDDTSGGGEGATRLRLSTADTVVGNRSTSVAGSDDGDEGVSGRYRLALAVSAHVSSATFNSDLKASNGTETQHPGFDHMVDSPGSDVGASPVTSTLAPRVGLEGLTNAITIRGMPLKTRQPQTSLGVSGTAPQQRPGSSGVAPGGWDQGNATAGGSRRHFGPGIVRRPMSSGPRRMGSALGVNRSLADAHHEHHAHRRTASVVVVGPRTTLGGSPDPSAASLSRSFRTGTPGRRHPDGSHGVARAPQGNSSATTFAAGWPSGSSVSGASVTLNAASMDSLRYTGGRYATTTTPPDEVSTTGAYSHGGGRSRYGAHGAGHTTTGASTTLQMPSHVFEGANLRGGSHSYRHQSNGTSSGSGSAQLPPIHAYGAVPTLGGGMGSGSTNFGGGLTTVVRIGSGTPGGGAIPARVGSGGGVGRASRNGSGGTSMGRSGNQLPGSTLRPASSNMVGVGALPALGLRGSGTSAGTTLVAGVPASDRGYGHRRVHSATGITRRQPASSYNTPGYQHMSAAALPSMSSSTMMMMMMMPSAATTSTAHTADAPLK